MHLCVCDREFAVFTWALLVNCIFFFEGQDSKNLKARLHQNSLNGVTLESYCPLFLYVHRVCTLNWMVCMGTVPIIALKST